MKYDYLKGITEITTCEIYKLHNRISMNLHSEPLNKNINVGGNWYAFMCFYNPYYSSRRFILMTSLKN